MKAKLKISTDEKPLFQTTGWIRAAWIAVLCFAAIGSNPTSWAFTSADADALFEAHAKAFYREENGRAWFTKDTEGGKADFWTRAEQLEMVLDAYERTTNAQQLVMFTNLFHGFLADHGTNWSRNEYNDDIMWMVIASSGICSVAATSFRPGCGSCVGAQNSTLPSL